MGANTHVLVRFRHDSTMTPASPYEEGIGMASALQTSEAVLPALKPLDHADIPARRPVTWRSLLLGLCGVLFICILTPYNDFVVNNTFLTGNFLPIGLVVFFLLVVMLVNAPLSRWAPGLALSHGEMVVALGMTLVSCAVPSSGLMRFLPAQLVGIWYHAGANNDYRVLLDDLHLPDWMFPDFHSTSAIDRSREEVVQQFWFRVPVQDDSFLSHWRAVPWAAWLRPALAWGVLFAAIFGAILCLATLVRRQWAENERLPFPLATLYVSLVEPPERGKLLGPLFRTRWFWISFLSVFCIHALNALNQYDKRWPTIPLKFWLTDMLTEEPWRYIDWFVKWQNLYFSIIGITFFIQSKIAFSIWFSMVLWQIPKMIQGMLGTEWSSAPMRDNLFGGMVSFSVMILWIGRGQWALVLRQMLRGPAAHEPQGRYLPYRLTGWGLVVCVATVVGWLLLAGASLLSAGLIVLMFFMVILVLMRIVAETGLMFVHFLMPLSRPWGYIFNVFPSLAADRATLRPYFFATLFDVLLGSSQRENLAVYSSNALRTADLGAYPQQRDWRQGIWFTAALVGSLAIGYVASGASTLYCEYTYSATLDRQRIAPINTYAMNDSVNQSLGGPSRLRQSGVVAPDAHSRGAHFALGAGITTLLSVLHLRYPVWPLHPIGYLLLHSWTIWLTWFSVFLGWLAKVVILRLGGGTMFRTARPFFIGLVLGECAAAGFWLVISLIRVALGLEYHAINLLPM